MACAVITFCSLGQKRKWHEKGRRLAKGEKGFGRGKTLAFGQKKREKLGLLATSRRYLVRPGLIGFTY